MKHWATKRMRKVTFVDSGTKLVYDTAGTWLLGPKVQPPLVIEMKERNRKFVSHLPTRIYR